MTVNLMQLVRCEIVFSLWVFFTSDLSPCRPCEVQMRDDNDEEGQMTNERFRIIFKLMVTLEEYQYDGCYA